MLLIITQPADAAFQSLFLSTLLLKMNSFTEIYLVLLCKTTWEINICGIIVA